MDEKTYKITLADDTIIDDLRLNGNNYISEKALTPAIFEYNCSPVVISDGDHEETHSDMDLVQLSEMNGEYWFVLRDISGEELAQIKLRSDLEYMAMMTGVDL